MASNNSSESVTADYNHITADPPSTPDHVLLYLASSLFFLTFLAYVFVLANYNHPPIKAKQVVVVGFNLFSAIFWFYGSHVSLGNIEPYGIFYSCTFWKVWGQIVLGLYCYLASYMIRLLTLYRILIVIRTPASRRRCMDNSYSQMALFLSPMFLLGFLCVFVPNLSYEIDPAYYILPDGSLRPTRICRLQKPITYALFGLVGIGLCCVAYFGYALRNIRRAFNERRQILVGVFMHVSALIINLIVVLPGFYTNVWARFATQVVILFQGPGFFWLFMGKPIYECITDRKGAEERFRTELHDDTLSVRPSGSQKIISNNQNSNTANEALSSHVAIDLMPSENSRASKISKSEHTNDDESTIGGATSECKLGLDRDTSYTNN